MNTAVQRPIHLSAALVLPPNMKTSIPLSFATFATFFCITSIFAQDNTTVANDIIANATAGAFKLYCTRDSIMNDFLWVDNIDLSVLSFLPAALDEITTVYSNSSELTKRFGGPLVSRAPASLVDVHSQCMLI